MLSGLLQGSAAAASTGMGCGGICSCGIGAFLPGYLVTHTRSMAESIKAFFSFYMGKTVAVACICAASSVFGQQLIGDGGYVGADDAKLAVDLFMIVIGLYFLAEWLMRVRPKFFVRIMAGLNISHTPKSCSGKCHKNMPDTDRVSLPALFGMGAGYGVTPCAPLFVIAGLCISMSPAAAAFTGIVFALSSAVFPFALLALISGTLSAKMRRELPLYLDYFQLFTYLILMAVYMKDLCVQFL